MISFTCTECHEEIFNASPRCNACSSESILKDIKEAVQSQRDEIYILSQTINIGETYLGEVRAYTKVLNILEKL